MQKTYLITGATSDVGTALIRRIARAGDIVIAQGAGDLEKLQSLQDTLPCKLFLFDVNLTDEAALDGFIQTVQAQFGAITHFVHFPALRMVNTKFKKFDEARFLLDMNVQVLSAVRICKAFLPQMAKNKYGRVLFMLTSYIIGIPPKNATAYIVAKNALKGLAQSLATEYAPAKVTVNCVAPYMMETKFLADTPDLVVQASAAQNPMGRNARVEDVVPAIDFLLSDEAGFITGAVLPITGGAAY
ncbi:MAG: SDR family oxidoreductase [Pygmaiobacter massiliensis]|nr:SDR family oxidoreductase [Pygmaiobacter massiliensis]